MIHLLLVVSTFLSAALLITALARWWAWIQIRNPEAFAGGSRDPIVHFWESVVSAAARELPGRRLGALRDQVRLDLTRAGEPGNADRFIAQSVLEGIALGLGFLLFFSLVSGGAMALLGLTGGVFHAFGLRPHLLRSRATERLGRISRRLPYAIDLAALVLGAGGTPREALELIARQETDPLAEEFTRALAEMQSGSPQHKALSDMADRLQLEDLSILVVAINRGESTGAPLAKALETQAEVFRYRRLQRAERLAVEAPVKMMFPNMLIMMSVLLLVLGPVIVQLVRDGMV